MSKRQLFDVELRPVTGSRFQPTGFPDIGTALFDRPVAVDGETVWQKAIVVESAQSMANRLEATAWDASADLPMPLFADLPYVRVVNADGDYLTSSRTEAHRLASAFVKDSKLDGQDMKQVIRERLKLGDDRPLSYRDIAGAVFELDPFCLVHGVFFAESAKVWPGQPKITRALTGGIEAYDVRRADSGGVKRDHVRHMLGDGEGGGSAEGYGTIPFHRTEWTAAEMVAMFSIDLGQFEAYGLPDAVTELLAAIARWEIRTLLDGAVRLRTACDLELVDDSVVDRAGEPLPSSESLASEISQWIGECSSVLNRPGPIEVVWSGGSKKAKS